MKRKGMQSKNHTSSTKRLAGKIIDESLAVGIPALLKTRNLQNTIDTIVKNGRKRKYKERGEVAAFKDLIRAF